MKRKIAQPIVHEPIIIELRKQFHPRTHLPVWACDKLMHIMENADNRTLKLIADANINFASTFATVEINHRLNKKGN